MSEATPPEDEPAPAELDAALAEAGVGGCLRFHDGDIARVVAS